MDRLGSLNAFVQTAELRSFTAAGRHMGISASAVGKAVSRLEDRMGVRLFQRNTRSIALTPEGSLLLLRCSRILSEIEAAEEELAMTIAAPRGRLRVSLPLLAMPLMPVIGDFARIYPEIDLDLDCSDRSVDLIEEGFDVVLRCGDVSDSTLMTRHIASFSHLLVASPAYLASHGIPACAQDLQKHRLLQHRLPNTGKLGTWPLRSLGDLELPATLTATTTEPLIRLAEQGLGITCVPAFLVEDQLANESLLPIMKDDVVETGSLRALWASRRHKSPKITAFVDFLAAHAFGRPARCEASGSAHIRVAAAR